MPNNCSTMPTSYNKTLQGFLFPPLLVFSKSLHEDQLNITADLKQTFLSPATNQNLNPAAADFAGGVLGGK